MSSAYAVDLGMRGTYRTVGSLEKTWFQDCLGMPRFYFYLVEGDRRVPDYKGADFESLAAARRSAESSVRDQLVARIMDDNEPDGREYEIVNSEGRVLDTIHFSDYLPPQLKS
jgi:hypothetical protein